MTARLGAGQVSSFKHAAWVKPSPTLYITNIPPPDNALHTLETSLQAQAGFEPPMRIAKGGAVAFADFKDVQSATDALHKLTGLQFEDWSGEGLRISYDKDDSKEKREKKAEQEALDKASRMCERLECNICSSFLPPPNLPSKTFCIKLSKPLAKLPRRGTDGSHVIDEAKHLVELRAKKGEVKHIKREKGVETQCRLECEHCSTLIAYRPVPIGEPTKYMYLLADVATAGAKEEAVRPAEKCLGAWPSSAKKEGVRGEGDVEEREGKRPKVS